MYKTACWIRISYLLSDVFSSDLVLRFLRGKGRGDVASIHDVCTLRKRRRRELSEPAATSYVQLRASSFCAFGGELIRRRGIGAMPHPSGPLSFAAPTPFDLSGHLRTRILLTRTLGI